MGSFQDLTGQRFGELVVLYRVPNEKNSGTLWLCKCDCGQEVIVFASNLTRGRTTSCGCTRIEKTKRKLTTHFETKTRLYRVWSNMLTRCYNENDPHYQHYGERGVSVCGEWLSYESFREWALSTGYTDKLTIERRDVNGNYEPSNCEWATIKQQANNKRNNRFIEFGGERLTIAQWADKLGMDKRALWDRLYVRNWSIERALTTPLLVRGLKKGKKNDT